MLDGVWFLLTFLKCLTQRYYILSYFGKTDIIQLLGFYPCPVCSVSHTSHTSAMHPGGIISIYFRTAPVHKIAAGCYFLLPITSHRYTVHQAFQNTLIFSLGLFYQVVLEECTVLLNIIVSSKRTKPKLPFLCDVLRKVG